ncbi:hypothetical protein IMCC20628_03589 [Hoeflea sp. IMCC20628]|nr:hypothetical protein IMCC20628_03589 [Hoeflea sp. IMCC20628]
MSCSDELPVKGDQNEPFVPTCYGKALPLQFCLEFNYAIGASSL